jgi:hypothetical protein
MYSVGFNVMAALLLGFAAGGVKPRRGETAGEPPAVNSLMVGEQVSEVEQVAVGRDVVVAVSRDVQVMRSSDRVERLVPVGRRKSPRIRRPDGEPMRRRGVVEDFLAEYAIETPGQQTAVSVCWSAYGVYCSRSELEPLDVGAFADELNRYVVTRGWSVTEDAVAGWLIEGVGLKGGQLSVAA